MRCVFELQQEAHYIRGLVQYVKYGLEMRELLEYRGPYDFKESIRFKSDRHIGSVQEKNNLDSHKLTYNRLAAESLIISSFSLFEFFIANVFLDLYSLSKRDNGIIDSHTRLVWEEESKMDFRSYCVSSGVGSDEWRNKNHLWEEQKTKIGILDKKLKTKIKTNKTKDGFFWQDFCQAREERLKIAHSTGRQTIFGGRAREKPIKVYQSAEHLLDFVVWISTQVEYSINEFPILSLE